MAEEKKPTPDGFDSTRRAVLKTGAVLIPTIVTLHASPAWAATDYTLTAYIYGTNAGLCRNPNFQAGSSAPWKSQEFMPCDQIVRSDGSTFDTTATQSGSSPTSIQF